jgi:hypothetical protein
LIEISKVVCLEGSEAHQQSGVNLIIEIAETYSALQGVVLEAGSAGSDTAHAAETGGGAAGTAPVSDGEVALDSSALQGDKANATVKANKGTEAISTTGRAIKANRVIKIEPICTTGALGEIRSVTACTI